ncbi:sialate O-acetylesterase-like [Haliotis rufescens]|uniref:sialate O-acetylesterase-like n=1 Tax=Haliotis rufescens TaxID=6454 RepID=UPI00201E9062|nr:sialate O-acetylesterase-like [Haliotis rufescens]
MKLSLVFAILACQLPVCAAYIKFAAYYQDHMVLQRGPKHAVVWGTSNKIGEAVTVEVSGGHGNVSTTVVADPDGELDGVWTVKLPAITDPGPFTVTASYRWGNVSIQDVLFGDVWICSGQSNMNFYVSRLFDPAKVVAEAERYHDIRVFRTHTLESNTTFHNLHGSALHWSKPSQASLQLFSAVCWLYAQYLYPHRKYPLGMVESAWGGTSIEAWSSPDALAKCPVKTKRGPNSDNVLWNSMMNPFTYMTIYGVLWYQGENNAHHPDRYACEFPAMIADWRSKFHQRSLGETEADFPFGFVQLAANNNVTYVGSFPQLRWAQTANLGRAPNSKMLNTFMAVAMDLPDFASPYGTIHPRYKEDVARRLLLAGRAVAYKETGLDFQGPFPSGFGVNDKVQLLNIEFSSGHTPIEVRNKDGFEVCCSSSRTTTCGAHDVWVRAPITTHDIKSVTVSTSGCGSRHLVGLRYEWRTSPCPLRKCAVYGRDNDLPAPPYIRSHAFTDSSSHIIG